MSKLLIDAFERVTDVTEAAPLQNELRKDVERAMKQVRKYNPYIQTENARKCLADYGIETLPYPTERHPHAACKAIENKMLVEAGHHLGRDATVCFMKKQKLKLLFGDANTSQVTLLNEVITPKDHTRYGDDVITNVLSHIHTKTAFVHDAMHYYTPDIIGHIFDENPTIQKLVYTLVIPPEVQRREKTMHPALYDIHYPLAAPDTFEFKPDGHQGGSYQQKIACAEWLYLGRVLGARSTVTVDRVESVGAHHLYIAVRGALQVDRNRCFQCRDWVELPKLWVVGDTASPVGVSQSLLKRLYLYGCSLKEVSERDLIAKIRQMLNREDLSHMDIMTIEELVHVTLLMVRMPSMPKSELLAGSTHFSRWSAQAKAKLYAWCSQVIGLTSACDVFRDAANLRPYNFDGPTVTRGIRRAFVRRISELTRVRGSRTGKRPAYHVDMDDLARMEPDVEAELRTESLVQNAVHDTRNGFETLDDLLHTEDASATSGPTHQLDQVIMGALGTENSPVREVGVAESGSGAITRAAEVESVERNDSEDGVHSEPAPEEGKAIPREPVRAASNLADAINSQVERRQPLPSPPSGFKSRSEEKQANPQRESFAKEIKGGIEWNMSDYCEDTLRITRHYGVDIQKREYDCDGGLIDPVWALFHDKSHWKDDVGLANETAAPFVKALNKVGRHLYTHKANANRASAYASDLYYGAVGTLQKNQHFQPRLEGLKKSCQRTTEEALVVVLLGAGGAGKSHQLQQVLTGHGGLLHDVTVVVPTTVLRDEWAAIFPKARDSSILTYERAIIKPAGSVVILDDFGKLPHGYVDLLMTRHTGIEVIILTGDFRQSVYHEVNQDAAIARLTPEMDVFARYTDYYLNLTRRCPSSIARALGVYPANPDPGKVAHSNVAPPGVPILVPATADRDGLNALGLQAFTYAGSQGITRDKITVMLTAHTPYCDERTMYTAFSRAKKIIYLTKDTLLDAKFDSKLQSTPYLRTLLELCREPEMPIEEVKEATVVEISPRTHLPVGTAAAIGDNYVEELPATEDRELYSDDHGRSNVYQAEEGEASRMQHHQAKDDTLVEASYKKRLRHQTPEENYREVIATRRAGKFLFAAFLKAYELEANPIPFDENLWNQCKQEVEGKYLQKTEVQLKQQEERQDPDFPDHYINLFLKSQWIKKDEKYGLERAKAGQPITSFKQATVMRTGVIARYVRRVLQLHQPHNIYIHTEQSDLDFHQWVRREWDFERESYESDYTMYDQSQGGECLNFETMLCTFLGVPAEEIHFYSTLKQHSEVYSGVLKVMRLSGEGPTFDFNTFCNIAYHHTKYILPRGTPQCYAGDDMAQCGLPVLRPGWAKIEHMFQLKAKPITSMYPSFIGFRLTPYGVVRSPLKLYRSLRLAQQRDNMPQMLEACARDIYYMYCLGDAAFDGNVFTEEEVNAHWLTVRIIHKAGYKPVRPQGADGILPVPMGEQDVEQDTWLPAARRKLQGSDKTLKRAKERQRQRERR